MADNMQRSRASLPARSLEAALGSLKSHRYSLVISALVTVLGLAIFVAINWLGGLRSAFVFLDNVEARSLDARFQFRGPVKPDPQIAIVAIDQKTIDRLGWPFPRSNYGRMLRTLTRDGAKVVGFDVDFSFPDPGTGGKMLSQLEEEYRRTHGSGAKDAYLERLRALRDESDSDQQFAKAIEAAGNVVLGHLFFADRAEIRHMDPERMKAYDEVLAFQAYPQVRKVTEAGKPAPSGNSFALQSASPIIGVEPNLRLFADAAKSYGAFNVEAENDGTYRRASLIFRYAGFEGNPDEETFYPSLDVQVARIFLGASDQDTVLWFNSAGPELIELGPTKIHPDLSGRTLINYAGPAQSYPHYSFSDVADGLTPPHTFQGKIVFVGATAIGIGDMRPTPFAKQNYPGVETHANVLDNMLHDRFLRRGSSEEITDLWVMLFCGVVMGLLFVMVRPVVSTVLFGIAVALLLGFVTYNFSAHGRWLSLVLPGTTLSMNYLGVVSYRVLFEEKEKRKVRGAFSQYVAPGFIAQILKEPGGLKLGGEQVELTVMFSDIRSFTSISEKLSPPALVELLNEYLTTMTDIVFQSRGTLDKYIGDAVMAFWGRPFRELSDHASLACGAALAMVEGLRKLNETWASQGRPTLRFGIGINTGPMMVGNMGSRRRFNYTVMGDHVNLASRVEGLTKEYGTQVLLTEFTYHHVAGQFVTRELDLIRVKGKKQPVAIYELLAPASEQTQYQELLKDFKQGLEFYKVGRWVEASEVFELLAEKFPSDGPTKLLLSRSRKFLEEAPEGVWDGVYTMTTK
jgi:adenylate cyclase